MNGYEFGEPLFGKESDGSFGDTLALFLRRIGNRNVCVRVSDGKVISLLAGATWTRGLDSAEMHIVNLHRATLRLSPLRPTPRKRTKQLIIVFSGDANSEKVTNVFAKLIDQQKGNPLEKYGITSRCQVKLAKLNQVDDESESTEEKQTALAKSITAGLSKMKTPVCPKPRPPIKFSPDSKIGGNRRRSNRG